MRAIIISTPGPRSTEEKARATRLFAAHVLPLVTRGLVRPILDRVFPAAEVQAAHQCLESDRSRGKVVLDFSS